MAAEDSAVPADRGEQAAKISRELVSIVRRTAGRGPTKARTTIGRDHVLVMLEDALTAGERTLVDRGRSEEVLTLRRAYQDVMGTEASAAVAAVVGRDVIGFMSANLLEPDRAAEVFLLDPSTASANGRMAEAEHLADDPD